MQKYPEITIVAIARRAKVERSTFYRNFDSKDGLVSHRISLIMREYLDDFIEAKHFTFYDYMLVVFTSIKANGNVFRLLIRDGLIELMLNVFREEFEDASGTKELSSEERFRINFHVGGIVNIIRYWVLNDFSDTPKQLSIMTQNIFSENFMPVRLTLMAQDKAEVNRRTTLD